MDYIKSKWIANYSLPRPSELKHSNQLYEYIIV